MRKMYIVMSEQVVNSELLKDPHAYFVGVFNDVVQAQKCAQEHSAFRDGKYTCMVAKVDQDKHYEMGLIPNENYVYRFNSRTDLIF